MNKFSKVFFGFLMLVSITGCTISFDDGDKNNNTNNENKINVSDNTTDKKDIKVVDAVNSFSNLSYSDKINGELPEIIGYSSSTINSINKSILSENLSRFYNSNPNSIVIDYDYTKKNDTLVISINTKINPWNASGNGEFNFIHFYDIKNDKELEAYDGLKALGYSDQDLLNNSSNCSFENGEPGNKCSIDAIKSDLNLESRSRCSKITVENGNIKLDLTDWCI